MLHYEHEIILLHSTERTLTLTGPGQGGSRIPCRRGRQPSRVGVPTYKFARFSQKPHEIKKMLVRWGAGARRGRSPSIRHCRNSYFWLSMRIFFTIKISFHRQLLFLTTSQK